MEAFDIDDERGLVGMRWAHAIHQWMQGGDSRDANRLADLVGSLDIPQFAREFLSDLVHGRVNRGKGGRPSKLAGWDERQIIAEVFAEWEKEKSIPKEKRPRGQSQKYAACATVAERRGESSDAIRGVMDKARKDGFTLENWVAWGRPDFKQIK